MDKNTFILDSRIAPVKVLPGRNKPTGYQEGYFVQVNVSYGHSINQTLLKHIVDGIERTKGKVFITGVGTGRVNWWHVSLSGHNHYLMLNVTNESELAHELQKENYNGKEPINFNTGATIINSWSSGSLLRPL